MPSLLRTAKGVHLLHLCWTWTEPTSTSKHSHHFQSEDSTCVEVGSVQVQQRWSKCTPFAVLQ